MKVFLLCCCLFVNCAAANPLIWQAEKQYGLPPALLMAVYEVETAQSKILGDYQALTVFQGHDVQLHALKKIAKVTGRKLEEFYGSKAGAIGPFQFIPTTWNMYGQPNDQGIRDPYDLQSAARSAAYYLAWLIAKHGSLKAALNEYSGGTPAYVEKVLKQIVNCINERNL
jgi:membrane-bound lytic murein transglycosylase B